LVCSGNAGSDCIKLCFGTRKKFNSEYEGLQNSLFASKEVMQELFEKTARRGKIPFLSIVGYMSTRSFLRSIPYINMDLSTIERDAISKGLTEETVRLISQKKRMSLPFCSSFD